MCSLLGPNGAGKSTLLKVISKWTDPSSGQAKIGDSIDVGYFGQFSFENLNMENTIFDEVRSKLPEASDGFIRNLIVFAIEASNFIYSCAPNEGIFASIGRGDNRKTVHIAELFGDLSASNISNIAI